MRVLVACEFSGIVRDAFISMNHDAISCDLLPTERVGPHYQGDVRDLLGENFDLMIAHPPCTHLAVSGARWFKYKRQEQADALAFVQMLMRTKIPRWCIENPVSVISRIRKPTQLIQPYQFGHKERKLTCLWLHNLPKLVPTEYVKDPIPFVHYCSGRYRARLRSITYPNIALAMASQWSNLSEIIPFVEPKVHKFYSTRDME